MRKRVVLKFFNITHLQNPKQKTCSSCSKGLSSLPFRGLQKNPRHTITIVENMHAKAHCSTWFSLIKRGQLKNGEVGLVACTILRPFGINLHSSASDGDFISNLYAVSYLQTQKVRIWALEGKD